MSRLGYLPADQAQKSRFGEMELSANRFTATENDIKPKFSKLRPSASQSQVFKSGRSSMISQADSIPAKVKSPDQGLDLNADPNTDFFQKCTENSPRSNFERQQDEAHRQFGPR